MCHLYSNTPLQCVTCTRHDVCFGLRGMGTGLGRGLIKAHQSHDWTTELQNSTTQGVFLSLNHSKSSKEEMIEHSTSQKSWSQRFNRLSPAHTRVNLVVRYICSLHLHGNKSWGWTWLTPSAVSVCRSTCCLTTKLSRSEMYSESSNGVCNCGPVKFRSIPFPFPSTHQRSELGS